MNDRQRATKHLIQAVQYMQDPAYSLDMPLYAIQGALQALGIESLDAEESVVELVDKMRAQGVAE